MIVTEISQNFTNLAEAKNLVKLAKENGADLVKAQLFDGVKLYGKKVPAELTFEDAKELFNYGKELSIEVFFSVFDVERVKWCEEIGVKRYKIAYGQRRNEDLAKAIAISRKPVYVSCSDTGDHCFWDSNYALLYCVPKYPTGLSDLDFNGRTDRRIWLRHWDSTNTFDTMEGYSDHTIGLDACKIAISRGVQIIEKHFAIDHETGVDAEWSMTPDELRELKRFELVAREAL